MQITNGLSQVFESVRPASDNIGKLLWFSLGAQTTKLIHENIHVGDVHQLDEFVLDADVIEEIFNNPDPEECKEAREDSHKAVPASRRRSQIQETERAPRGIKKQSRARSDHFH
jgi:hypothetical protein